MPIWTGAGDLLAPPPGTKAAAEGFGLKEDAFTLNLKELDVAGEDAVVVVVAAGAGEGGAGEVVEATAGAGEEAFFAAAAAAAVDAVAAC